MGLGGWVISLYEAPGDEISEEGQTVVARTHEILPGLRRASIVFNKDHVIHEHEMRAFDEVVAHELAHVIFGEAGSDIFWADNKAYQELEEELCDRIALIVTSEV